VATVLASPINGKPLSDLTVPGDGIDVARWLRDHSDPDDLVATNVHYTCYPGHYTCDPRHYTCYPRLDNACDTRSYWVSAYSERRILVEGWGTSGTPFWDPSLLAANDMAFTDPSAAAVAKLRDAYGVHWLFADLTSADSDSIGRYADLRYREGDFAVYELRGP